MGGSPATEPLTGIETEIPSTATVSSPSTPSTSSTPSISSTLLVSTPQTSTDDDDADIHREHNRRDLLDKQLRNHKKDKLKRKLPSSQKTQNNWREELEIKRKMVEKLEEMDIESEEQLSGLMSTFNRMASSLETLVKCQGQAHQFPRPTYYNQPNQHNTQQMLPPNIQSNPLSASRPGDFSGTFNHLHEDQL